MNHLLNFFSSKRVCASKVCVSKVISDPLNMGIPLTANQMDRIRGGCNFYKRTVSELIQQRARQIIPAQSSTIECWKGLLQPLSDWKNEHFLCLSVLLDVSTCTVKRIFSYGCHENETDQISPSTKMKVAKFLQTDNLDHYVYTHILQNTNIPK